MQNSYDRRSVNRWIMDFQTNFSSLENLRKIQNLHGLRRFSREVSAAIEGYQSVLRGSLRSETEPRFV